tara:strand:+ start:5423 stop:6826 length:1404 start_codon:yes stop_codon:yes gene_type:complete
MAVSLITAIALDLGTTSIKAALLDRHGTLRKTVNQTAPNIIAHHGHYESNALHYAETAEQVLEQCRAQTSCIPPLGLCSQRSSFLIWDKTSGHPLTPLIFWQDNRGIARCETLRTAEPAIRHHSGLHLTPYYLAPKLRILLQEHPAWRTPLERGELLVGTLDTFLIWRWTQGKFYLTDASMAARTLLMDRHQLQWSPVLCKLFDIPLSILPQIKPSVGINLLLDNGLTLQASVGDQSAAFITSVAKHPNKALVNLGTGGFVMRYQTTKNNRRDGYLHTLIYQDNSGHTHTALEGTINSIATALSPYSVQECQIADLATTDIFCLAEPSGLGAPYFRDDWGIHFSHSVEHLTSRQIAALLLEAIIFRITRILEDFHNNTKIDQVYLSGGLSELSTLQQGIAQCIPLPVFHLQQKETSLQGAGILAANTTETYLLQAEKIAIVCNNNALIDKYPHWKDWLDHLLAINSG